MRYLFTSESVTCGHPDKLCDIISDSVLDQLLSKDEFSRSACECSATKDFLLIMGEITSKAKIDVEEIARKAIREIGYDTEGVGFNADTVKIDVRLNTQSPDIAMGVDNSTESSSGDAFDKIGAGDHSMMLMVRNCCTHSSSAILMLPI